MATKTRKSNKVRPINTAAYVFGAFTLMQVVFGVALTCSVAVSAHTGGITAGVIAGAAVALFCAVGAITTAQGVIEALRRQTHN